VTLAIIINIKIHIGGERMEDNEYMIRHIDDLGRLAIPKEIREQVGLVNKGDPVRMKVHGDMIIVRKHDMTCIGCYGSMEYNPDSVLLCEKCWNILLKNRGTNK
jgi:bifunctional DNA-binding transcriptional regulator/antitoxin component of YhaV-PrlF toxin-antitoxin module